MPPRAYRLPAVDESHLLGTQLILNAHGIPHTVHRELTENVSTWARYIVVDAADFDRATALVSELQVTPPAVAAWNQPSFRRFAAAATLLMVGTVLLLLLRTAS